MWTQVNLLDLGEGKGQWEATGGRGRTQGRGSMGEGELQASRLHHLTGCKALRRAEGRLPSWDE